MEGADAVTRPPMVEMVGLKDPHYSILTSTNTLVQHLEALIVSLPTLDPLTPEPPSGAGQGKRWRYRRQQPDPDELTRGYAAGATLRQLAETYGLSRTTIADLLRQQGIQLRPRRLSPDQITEAVQMYLTTTQSYATVATHYGVDAQAIRYHVKKELKAAFVTTC